MKYVYFLVFLHRAMLPGNQQASCTTLIQPDVFQSFSACEKMLAERHYDIPYAKYHADVSTAYCVTVDEKSAVALYSAFHAPFIAKQKGGAQ